MGSKPEDCSFAGSSWIQYYIDDIRSGSCSPWNIVLYNKFVSQPVLWLVTLTAVPQGLSSNPGENMDVCKCIVPLRHGGTLNSRRAISPLVWMVEEEEKSWLPPQLASSNSNDMQQISASFLYLEFLSPFQYPPCCRSSSCSRSHRILKCVGSGLVVFRASPDVEIIVLLN
ncbi:hypothetical protein TNCV_4765961 [Trichonephila clavipes]|nr:hypothetical protein TNCV_4765961 [Trichonephila clavipes]